MSERFDPTRDSIDDAKSAAQDHLLSLLGDILEEVGE